MKCQVCDTRAMADAKFCHKCGARLPARDHEAPSEQRRSTARPAAASTAPASSGSTDPATGAAGPGAVFRRRRIVDVPEEVLWEGRYSAKAMVGQFIVLTLLSFAALAGAIYLGAIEQGLWGVVVMAALFVCWMALGMRLSVRQQSIHYKLTNQMFYHQEGLVRRVTNRIEVIDIDDVTYEQGPMDRTFNVGRIKIISSDRTDPELWLDGIDDVQQVAHMIDQARRAERLRRGLTIDAG